MKECALQLICLYKTPKQQQELYNFIKEYSGEVLVSVPINPRGKKK